MPEQGLEIIIKLKLQEYEYDSAVATGETADTATLAIWGRGGNSNFYVGVEVTLTGEKNRLFWD